MANTSESLVEWFFKLINTQDKETIGKSVLFFRLYGSNVIIGTGTVLMNQQRERFTWLLNFCLIGSLFTKALTLVVESYLSLSSNIGNGPQQVL